MTAQSRLSLPPGYRDVPERAVLYCDESGNSGPNYLDSRQPFYALAGWVIPDRTNEQVWVAVERLRRRFSPQSAELKSAAFLRGERQKGEAVGLFTELAGLGAIPLYLIAEKRFCVAGKIVETFLDPLYNPLLRNAITGDRETKQEIANLLYDRLPDPILTQFAEAYRRPDGSGLKSALLAVASAARTHLNPELAEALLGSTSQIDEIAEAEAANSLFGNVAATLNLPCLVSFLMMAESLGRLGLHQPIRFVHDRQHAYEEGYRKIFELHRGMPHLFARLPEDEVPFGRLETVAEFETADSKDRLPIQAADVLAGVINHLMQLAMNGGEPSEADIELARLTLPGLLVADVKIAWPIWSDQCIGRVASSLLVRAIRPPARSEDEIRRAKAVAEAQTAPVLPALRGSAESSHAFKMPCPLFGLRGAVSGNLMILVPTETEIRESDGDLRLVVPLFSGGSAAASFLESLNHLTEPQEVVAFDGPEMPLLVDLLDACAPTSDMIVFDPMSEKMVHLYLPAFLEGTRAILNRVRRLVGSGFDRVVLQRTEIGGREAISMLLSDGRYGAMWGPVGEVVTGATREEAITNLERAGLPQSEGAGG